MLQRLTNCRFSIIIIVVVLTSPKYHEKNFFGNLISSIKVAYMISEPGIS